MSKKKSFALMAFASGRDNTEVSVFKRYYGIGVVKVLGVNPNAEEFEKLRGFAPSTEPVYIGKQDDTSYVRFDFIIKTIPEENNGIDITDTITFFVRNKARLNRDGSKLQVIDSYGRTAWVTKEQYDNQEIPMYANGPANISDDYRPCFEGEDSLTDFVRTYLNIPNVEKWENRRVVGLIDNPETAKARFDNIENYFKGEYKELKDIVSYQTDNKVKVMFGIRTNDEGKQFSYVYPNLVMNPNASNGKLMDEIQKRQNDGYIKNVEFFMGDLKEYLVEPTNLDEPSDIMKPGNAWFT